MIEPRLRAILLGIAAAGFAGMIAEREIHAGASTGAVLWGALRGVAPAMAPGGLAMAALVAVAATWRSQARRGEPVAGQSS